MSDLKTTHDGRDALGLTPVPGDLLEKGRPNAPMVPVPTQTPKPTAPEKKK
jgi:hypothetical protein